MAAGANGGLSDVTTAAESEAIKAMPALTEGELTRLAQLEDTIEQGVTNERVGQLAQAVAMVELEDAKLFRCRYISLSGYAQDTFGFTKTHINRLLLAGRTMINLDGLLDGVPVNERQLRALAHAGDRDAQRKLWRKVTAYAQKHDVRISARLIDQLLLDTLQGGASQAPDVDVRPRGPKVQDECGHEIEDEEILRTFQAWEERGKTTRDELREIRNRLSLIRTDEIGRNLHEGALNGLTEAINCLDDCRPYSLCPDCRGQRGNHKCQTCDGYGWICHVIYRVMQDDDPTPNGCSHE
jgi:hypothetical protein